MSKTAGCTDDPLSYRELTFKIPDELSDLAAGLLWEAGTLGFEVLDQADPAHVLIKAYFPDSVNIEYLASDLKGLVKPMALHNRIITGERWPDRWKQYYEGCPIGETLFILPPWELDSVSRHPERLKIMIDPGAAFGTGQHSTTALCLERLEACPPKGLRCLDLGAGSGILTIAALKLGALSVVAMDRDPGVLSNFLRNQELNGLTGRASLILGTQDCLKAARFDLLIANIDLKTIATNAPVFRALVTPSHGRLILSGFLEEDTFEVLQAYRESGSTACSSFIKDGWGAVEVRPC